MNTFSKSIMLVTNGAVESLPALEYGAWLAGKLQMPVRLLGISEGRQSTQAVAAAVQMAQAQLDKLGLAYEIQLEQGEFHQVICRLADPQKNLVIFGPSGSPRWLRWLRGRKFRRILKDINTPLVYVPAARAQINNILVCMGGLGYSRSVEHWAIYLAQHTSASLTILHVVETIYYEYPTTVQIQTQWEELLNTDTPQARNLTLGVEIAEQAGIPVEIKVRHGDIIHEILAEIEAGQYDLIALGSQGSGRSLRRLYTPNVTAEVAEAVSLPVLTAHADLDLIFE
jgi:nucleotide-binding universal stress UspA family protein